MPIVTAPLINLPELEDLLVPIAGIWIPDDDPANDPIDGGFMTTETVCFSIGNIRSARRLLAAIEATRPTRTEEF